MRTVFSCVLIALLTFGFSVNQVSAKGFGGARSFGGYRSKSMFSNVSRAKPVNSSKARNGSGMAKKLFTGLLIGGLLSTLFMGNGLGSGLFLWLILGIVGFMIVNHMRRKPHAHCNSCDDHRHIQ